MNKVAIVYHSGSGHTKLQAEAVRDGAASLAGVEVQLLTSEEGIANIGSLADADAIVFGSPTYMGSVSGPMKMFMDATSKAWFTGAWRDKIAGGFTNSSSASGDKLNTLVQFVIVAAQLQMIWVGQAESNQTMNPEYDGPADAALNRQGYSLGAAATSYMGKTGPDNPPKGDIATAFAYGKRIAQATQRWNAK